MATNAPAKIHVLARQRRAVSCVVIVTSPPPPVISSPVRGFAGIRVPERRIRRASAVHAFKARGRPFGSRGSRVYRIGPRT